ncbi:MULTISPECIES: hypothetical protein [Enterobacter cloacae complex]|uniref:hypothetical protein n=1 Tax=Enterobacter cloacae complex TaxID=354276 RepID=UPI001121133E|nr:hypothetical protein [Enterobacter cloacae]MCM7134501.1 hypothetical protein [Enterobacter cloacae]MCM7493794.1 hypothetical protein [Enterobacter cloacae]TOZ48177.1 hypothetical protein DK925_06305 [Enterobacter cloacae]UJC65792.1 hypothetical protein J4G41_18140 [Enterobacter cloacae]HED5620046.1 hypothetical protein [Enterobacter cloacae]
MERKFMIYQRRDGFQIAEEATGTRLDNGMDMLARPNKSADWCFAAFNIDLIEEEDGYELVGEESIDCSVPPAQMIEFVDGVMKISSTCAKELDMDEAHVEALEINAAIDNMIAARQHIANKKPDFSQETWDLVRLGNSYKEAGREWYRWAKATALRLWENRLTQRQLFQMQ